MSWVLYKIKKPHLNIKKPLFLTEALRGWLKSKNVKVNVVCPDFIKTPLMDVNVFLGDALFDVARKSSKFYSKRKQKE